MDSGRPASPAPIAEHHYWATKTIVWATLVIFAGQVLASFSRGTGFPILSGGHPVDLLRFGMMPIDANAVREEPFRLVSCVFVHFGALHFVLNMIGLVNFARVAEPVVGSARFVIAYVAAGVAGSAATIGHSLLTRPGGTTVGASGAVFGVMGLLLGWMIRRKNPAWKDFAIQAVLFSVLFGFGVNASNAGVMINNAAHIGGLVCGVALGLVFGGRRANGSTSTSTPGREAAVNVVAGLCLVVCLASFILAQLSPKWRRLNDSLKSEISPRREPPALIAAGRLTKARAADV